MKVSWRRFSVRTAICLVVVGAAYFALFILPRLLKPSTLPDQPFHALRATLNDNQLVTSNISAFNGGGAAAESALSGLASRLEATQTTLEQQISKNAQVIGGELSDQTRGILEAQKPLLSDFKSRLSTLSKPLSYNPADNLGLNIDTNRDELQGRASGASTALENIANNTQLSVEAASALRSSATCFKKLSEDFTATGRSRCSKEYEKNRKIWIGYVTGIFRSDNAKQMTSDSEKLIKELDQKITGS